MNRNYSKLEDEFENAERIVFKRPDGTEVVVKTSVPHKLLSISQMPMRYADERHIIFFDKDIVSVVRLNNILGVDYVENLTYTVDSNDDVVKCITIMDSGQVIGKAEKYHYKGVRKRFKRNRKPRYNELVNEISKEYTFRLPDGRVILGADLNDYEPIPWTGEVQKAIRFMINHTKHRIYDLNLLITFGFIMEKSGGISLGFINALTGEYLAFICHLDDVLTKENKERLHKKREEYLDTLTDTEIMINNKLNRGE